MYRTTFRTGFQKPLRMPLLEIGHPLAVGLVCAWLFNEGGGITIKDASGNQNDGTLTSIDPANAWLPVAGPVGSAITLDGSTQTTGVISTKMNSIPLPNAAFSIAVRWLCPTLPAAKATVWSLDNGATLTSMTALQYRTATPAFGVFKSGGTALVLMPSSGEPAGGVWHDSLYVSGSPNPQQALYVDGVLQATGTIATNTIACTEIAVGQDSVTAEQLTGSFEYFYVWNRALTADEYRLLRSAPYDMFSLI